CQVGHFEAKGYFLPKQNQKPIWPAGSNLNINVEPAHTCCGNTIYNAFVRQFGPNKSGGFFDPRKNDEIGKMDGLGYTVIPPSGTFRNLIKDLDFIFGELGCRYIQLLPIYPTPTTYARMGRFGSPYAALSFTAVDPALAEFDVQATPLEQFIELVDAIHLRRGRVIIDIAINHTGWAANLHEMHPEWLSRDAEGRIEVPGAWGVRWEDLTKLDYRRKDLWTYMSQVFLTWCRRGVDGFRCDAGYMIPVEAWKYMISVVRDQYPDTIFFLEGLGGKVSVARDLLNTANFNWVYSELFQNYDRRQIEGYLPGAIDIAESDGLMVHYAETHDNNRLASRSIRYAKMRTALCALLSHSGGFGFTNGVEWHAYEKIIVHESPSLNWGSPENQVREIATLCRLLKNHPSFFNQTHLELIQRGDGNNIVLLRRHIPSGKRVLVAANLDDHRQNHAEWEMDKAQMKGDVWLDLLTGTEIKIELSGGIGSLSLLPGQVLCLADERTDFTYAMKKEGEIKTEPERILDQRLRAKVLDLFRHYKGISDADGFSLKDAAEKLQKDPEGFCRSISPSALESRVIRWEWPRDLHREVMVPPGHFLLVLAKNAFRAQIFGKNRVVGWEESIPGIEGIHFGLFLPQPVPGRHTAYFLKLVVYQGSGSQHSEAPLLYLSGAHEARLKNIYRKEDLEDAPLYFLATNHLGGTLQQPVDWGRLGSRYDAILAANPKRERPSDRWIMLTRCRAWVVHEDYSQEINSSCMESFFFEDHRRGIWRFEIPTGRGRKVAVRIALSMRENEHASDISILRESADGRTNMLEDPTPVRVILRPDLENRNFHDVTKAYLGPERHWRNSTDVLPEGFFFKPDDRHELHMTLDRGDYLHEPEWHYMVYLETDAQRGQDPHSDLFSPGYFSTFLRGGEEVVLTARITDPGAKREKETRDIPETQKKAACASGSNEEDAADDLKPAMMQFMSQRDGFKTVIAGYPWFLDWGRDSLIFARGLIAAGEMEAARSVIKQFGRFEENGTLPNMVGESGPGNRDTSDAPLWFVRVCEEMTLAEGNWKLLSEKCGGRRIKEVVFSIMDAMIRGTPNGIKVDPDSGLIFSPAHFTWMDTNFPAGTPRQGYPVEIQALWYSALRYSSEFATAEMKKRWRGLAQKVKKSIASLYFLEQNGYLSDCLHARPGEIAAKAEKDDALRPNQLLAVTLGAVHNIESAKRILSACQELLIPGAIRSLS
ncbi:MAG: glycogen debranching protein, partial [Deltaproteobacteria bacterium RBG_13_49_15]